LLNAVEKELAAQLKNLGRAIQTLQVLKNGLLPIYANSLEAVAEIANYVAPEHLELMVAPASVAFLEKNITTAGAMLIGPQTPTVLGDFTAGPSHVLPTGRAGRFFSGLRVVDFLRRTSTVHYDSASLRRLFPSSRPSAPWSNSTPTAGQRRSGRGKLKVKHNSLSAALRVWL